MHVEHESQDPDGSASAIWLVICTCTVTRASFATAIAAALCIESGDRIKSQSLIAQLRILRDSQGDEMLPSLVYSAAMQSARFFKL